MTLKIPPPPFLTNPDLQALNRWLIEVQSILGGSVATLADGVTGVTQPVGDNSNKIATDAFVLANSASTPSTTVPLPDATPGQVGVSTKFARGDHVHPTDTTRAPLASPAFTGNPEAPTQAVNDDSVKLATTQYTDRAVAIETNRAEAVEALLAPINNPVFTGAPLAPTAAPGTATAQLATTLFVSRLVEGFSVSLSANEATTQNVYTKLTNFTVVNFDQTGNYSGASQRWTPAAGLVLLHLSIITTPSLIGSQVAAAIYKNGAVLHANNRVVESSADSSAGLIPEVLCLDQASGTDYYEAFFFSGSPTPSALAQPSTFFEGLQITN